MSNQYDLLDKLEQLTKEVEDYTFTIGDIADKYNLNRQVATRIISQLCKYGFLECECDKHKEHIFKIKI